MCAACLEVLIEIYRRSHRQLRVEAFGEAFWIYPIWSVLYTTYPMSLYPYPMLTADVIYGTSVSDVSDTCCTIEL
jgi:hypothetical protein